MHAAWSWAGCTELVIKHGDGRVIGAKIPAEGGGKEIKDAEVTCDVCGCDCAEESYLYDDEMDICPRCFKLDAESAQQYEDATHQRWGKPVE